MPNLRSVEAFEIWVEDCKEQVLVHKEIPVPIFVDEISNAVADFLNTHWEEHKKNHKDGHIKTCDCCGFVSDGVTGEIEEFPYYYFYLPQRVQLSFLSSYVENIYDKVGEEKDMRGACGAVISSAEEIFCCAHTSLPSISLTEFSEEKLVITVSSRAWYSRDQENSDVSMELHIPFRYLKGSWHALQKNAFYSNCKKEARYEFSAGNITMVLDPVSEVWKEALFLASAEEKLMFLVKHYLLSPDDSNPLTILLRSPQPTRGLAKQLENLLRNAAA